MQHVIVALFALALIVVGWQCWVMVSARVGRAATFLGWFGAVACAINFVWVVWFYAQRLIGSARSRDSAA
jgi:hypothetical protein